MGCSEGSLLPSSRFGLKPVTVANHPGTGEEDLDEENAWPALAGKSVADESIDAFSKRIRVDPAIKPLQLFEAPPLIRQRPSEDIWEKPEGSVRTRGSRAG